MAGKHATAPLTLAALLLAACSPAPGETETAPPPAFERWATPALSSLEDLSIETLRKRDYGSVIQPISRLDSETGHGGQALLATYESDGHRVYARIDIPAAPPPTGGYPVVIFVHGWYGIDKAPSFDFFQDPDSMYARLTDRLASAGFAVLSPALRGHGTVGGIPADGIEFLAQWDNGSYLGPMFYAIDTLNLLEGIESLENIDWIEWGTQGPVLFDRSRISITGHSQGGDAVLTALAVSGEGSAVRNALASGSIVSGCFGPRLEQVELYGPMSNTLQAFMSGDGSWTGSATGPDGSTNADFVFGFPPDWIGTVDPQSPDWTWQAGTWSVPSVAESLQLKYNEMYQAVNMGIADISGATFSLEKNAAGRTVARHDERLEAAMQRIGGYHYEQFLTEPLQLHHSDQDYYSPPRWNADLSSRINATGGESVDFTYAQNTHSLGISKHDWFSRGEVTAGFEYMIERDIELFASGSTAAMRPAGNGPVSPGGLSRYAKSLKNEFEIVHQREPLDGHARRVVRFEADGLEQYALVAEPAGPAPERGWPVLLMSHGYHPEPKKNGRLEDGRSDRPGDYYRGLPLAYARQGFLVIWPDFRGHNISEGFEYTKKKDATGWYTRDVIAAFRSLGSLPNADTDNVFLWGHSMGGNITLRALAALNGEIRGASVWAARLSDPDDERTRQLAPHWSGTPLLIQHAADDPSVASDWSRAIHSQLQATGHDARLFIYAGEDHLFKNNDLEQAISRDITFFTEFMR